MTNAELILKLQELPSCAEVLIEVGGDDAIHVDAPICVYLDQSCVYISGEGAEWR
jgi:hypothetical protein